MELLESFGVFDSPNADVEGGGADTAGWSDGGKWPCSCCRGADGAGRRAGMLGDWLTLTVSL